MGLITLPNYYKYFLLFKLIAEHTSVLTFTQLVENNWRNVSGRKNFLVAKFIGDQRSHNKAGDRGLDKSNSLNIKSVLTWWSLYVLSNTWSSIHEEVKQHEVKLKKCVTYKKKCVIH